MVSAGVVVGLLAGAVEGGAAASGAGNGAVPAAVAAAAACLGLVLAIGVWAVRRAVVRPLRRLAADIERRAADPTAPPDRGARPRLREFARLDAAVDSMVEATMAQRAALADQAASQAEALARARDVAEAARVRADAASTARTEFLVSMSHELRTPLNAVLGFSEVLRDELFGPLTEPRYRAYARDIHASGCRLRDLIDKLFDLTLIESGGRPLTPESLEIAREIEACVRRFDDLVTERGMRVHATVAPHLPPLVADRSALRQILNNLLSNAIKFTPPGGIVRMDASWADDRIVISVSDTGIGIAKPFHDLVFSARDRVVNVHTRQLDGTGLGLALVKALMDQHGGTVTLESRLGKGATFTLAFPVRPTVVIWEGREWGATPGAAE